MNFQKLIEKKLRKENPDAGIAVFVKTMVGTQEGTPKKEIQRLVGVRMEAWKRNIRNMYFKGLLYTRNEKIIAINNGDWHRNLDKELKERYINQVERFMPGEKRFNPDDI